MSIFLKNIEVQKNLVEPDITEIKSIEDIQAVAEYIRNKNYLAIQGGDARLCRQINGEIAAWIKDKTSAKADLWICSPYPNLRNTDIAMEHVVCVVTSSEIYIVDGTAGQTTVSNSSIFVQAIEGDIPTATSLSQIMGGNRWKPF